MKKILILILLLITIPVCAKENKLYLVKDKKAIKYESGLYDDKIFMKHVDMVPGSKFNDELTIENGTDAENLLKNINMKITLDDKLIYYGPANGKGNIDLADSIYLGEFVPNKSVKMVVETYLSTEYENPKEDDHSYIDWTFYAQLDGEPPQEVVPITGANKSNIIVIISVILISIAFVLLVVFKNKKEIKAI